MYIRGSPVEIQTPNTVEPQRLHRDFARLLWYGPAIFFLRNLLVACPFNQEKTGARFKTVITVGSRFATVRFATVHFYDTCLVGPSTPDLWYNTFVTQASFST